VVCREKTQSQKNQSEDNDYREDEQGGVQAGTVLVVVMVRMVGWCRPGLQVEVGVDRDSPCKIRRHELYKHSDVIHALKKEVCIY
jgi:hypothetical protein